MAWLLLLLLQISGLVQNFADAFHVEQGPSSFQQGMARKRSKIFMTFFSLFFFSYFYLRLKLFRVGWCVSDSRKETLREIRRAHGVEKISGVKLFIPPIVG